MKNKNIALLVVLVIVLIVAGLAFSWNSVQDFLQLSSQEETAPVGDTTLEIEQALNQVDVKDLDAELQGIDTDLNSL